MGRCPAHGTDFSQAPSKSGQPGLADPSNQIVDRISKGSLGCGALKPGLDSLSIPILRGKARDGVAQAARKLSVANRS